MAGIELRDYQLDAVYRMKNGCILCGDVGSGKSRTAIAYYYICNGGKLNTDHYVWMSHKPQDLYIITTAKKRDTCEWEGELAPFLLTTSKEGLAYDHKVVVDSWNNIKKYKDVKGAFFIFDEQRVVGYGEWSKTFIKIARSNNWILLSATPGDKWEDYIPVFIANGFYKNVTEFRQEHLVYASFTNFPKVIRYLNVRRLTRLRDLILVDMDFNRKTVAHHEDVFVSYDILSYKDVCKTRWNPFTNKPIKNAAEFCGCLRQIVNSDETRQTMVLEILEKHPKAIIFYQFDYELAILQGLAEGNGYVYSEWNGHKHQPIPEGDKWVYLVQYTAGSEGWNCIRTNTIIFYSQSYSYRVMKQSSGRIDRMNTPYKDLYYYHLKSRSSIDLAIGRALKNKKKFNETRFYAGKG